MKKNKGGGTIIFYTNYGVTMNYEKINATNNAMKNYCVIQTESETELEKMLSKVESFCTDTDFDVDGDDEDDRSKAATQLLISRGE